MPRWLRFLPPPLVSLPLLALLVVALARGPLGGSPEASTLSAAPSPPASVAVGGGAPATESAPSSSAPGGSAVEVPPAGVAAVAAVVPTPLAGWAAAPMRSTDRPPPDVAGDAAVVMDEASGAVLYQKAAHARLAPASVTKIMTALLALERGDLQAQVDVTVDSTRMRGSTVMGLMPGERLPLEGLLYGMMLPSGNDAALAIAEHISGDVPRFVELMNRRAAELGMADTRFVNPHGLDNPQHYTSAYDLALLTRAAMRQEGFHRIADTKYVRVQGRLRTYELGTLNPLYGRLAGVDGVKTGYTRNARQTLVGSAMRDGHRVYVVLLRSPDRASDGVSLLNWAFASFAWPSPNTVASAAGPSSGT